ncbi:hypothetical protein LTR95_008374 [Oleoguttula sp. CCFEE 5521]
MIREASEELQAEPTIMEGDTSLAIAISGLSDEDVCLSDHHGLLREGSFATTDAATTLSTINHQEDQQPATIFCLPLELRSIIYDLLFHSTFADDILDRQSCFPLPAILRTCSFLRIDAAKPW